MVLQLILRLNPWNFVALRVVETHRLVLLTSRYRVAQCIVPKDYPMLVARDPCRWHQVFLRIFEGIMKGVARELKERI